MASQAPAPRDLDATELGLIEYRKLKLFPSSQPVTDYCHLVSAASQHGLVFVATPNAELKVILSYRNGEPHRIRTVPLPSPSHQIAVNCDASLLAVEILSHDTPLLQIYSVASFLAAQPQLLQTIRVCPEEHVRTRQLCWNPVLPHVLAICLHNGGLNLFSLKDAGGGFDFHSLNKSNAVQSICWSPKGKQLVAGQRGFRLVQYKPDLSVARQIQCPADAAWGLCNVITVQWLSTYQFAVAILPQAADAVPQLLVVNAPKSNQISMVNYKDDLCYGDSGPRAAQILFLHLHEWNMLLVASANSPDINLLATTEPGDAPTWVQYCLEPPVVTPTVERREQSFPVGFTVDSGGVRVMNKMSELSPARLSIHVMANYGDLVSFSVANNLPDMKDVCSPPAPARDTSGLHLFVQPSSPTSAEDGGVVAQSPPQSQTVNPKPTAIVQEAAAIPPAAEMTFNFGAASTPIVQNKATSVFGGAMAPPTTAPSGGLFGSNFNAQPAQQQQQQQPPVKPASTLVFAKIPEMPPLGTSFQQPATSVVAAPSVAAPPTFNTAAIPTTKPLISVPPQFAPPVVVGAAEKSQKTTKASTTTTAITATDDAEDQEALAEMMREDIEKADAEIKELINRCRSFKVSLGTKEEMKGIMKDLSGLTDFSQQAVESSDQLGTEVRMLNLSLNEAFSTTRTASDFFALYKNPEGTRPRDYMAQNPANRRRMMRLENALVNNEQQMNFIQRQVMAQWAEHEEVRRQYSKDRMHIPCLEGVYETLTRQKEILFGERQKINYLTTKLGVRLLSNATETSTRDQQTAARLESVADSMLSMTLNETLSNAQHRVAPRKLKQLTQYLAVRPVTVVCPARPQNGMSSDVILARKEKLIKSKQSARRMETNATVVASAAGNHSVVKTKIPVVTEIGFAPPPPAAAAAQKPVMQVAKEAAPAGIMAFGGQKPAAVSQKTPLMTAKPSFGGFGDNSNVGSKQQPLETKAAINVAVKENVAPNAFGSKSIVDSPAAAATGFSGFGGLNLTSTTTPTVRKEEPARPATPSFSFNIPQTTLIGSTTESNSKPVGGGGVPSLTTVSSGGTNITFPSSVTVTAIPPASSAASTTKSFFGGMSSGGPLTFGGNAAAAAAASVGSVDQKQTAAAPKDTNAVLDSLKICSPTVKATTTAIPTAVTATSPVVDTQKSLFSSNVFGTKVDTTTPAANTNTTAAPVTSPFSGRAENLTTTTTAAAAATTAIGSSATSIFSGFGKTTAPPAATATTTSSGSFFGSGFGGTATTSIFGSPTATPPVTTSAVVPDKTATPTTTLPKPDQSVFGQVASSTTTDATLTSSASSAAAAASAFSFGNMGLGSSAPAASPFGVPATAGAAAGQSMFGGTAAAPTGAASAFGGAGGSMFGGTGTAFGSPGAAAAAATTTTTPTNGSGSIFGGGSPATLATPAATGGSIFGGGGGGGGSAATSIFGGGGGGTTSVFGGGQATSAPFGAAPAATATAAPTGNIFGSPSSNAQTTGGSIFGGGGGAFGSGTAAPSQGSIFGGGAPASGGFSFASASAAPAFGAPAAQQGEATSPFGGGGAPTTAFGQPQSPFGGGGGAAAASGAGMFGKPAAFGSPPAFGSPATFGGPPVFGGGASFGGGGGGAASAGGGFGSPSASPQGAQQNSLFASLGSSESSLSFGNLAQTNAMQQAKPAFGGSAFSSWR